MPLTPDPYEVDEETCNLTVPSRNNALDRAAATASVTEGESNETNIQEGTF